MSTSRSSNSYEGEAVGGGVNSIFESSGNNICFNRLCVVMEFQFTCGCGEEISEFTRGEHPEVSTQVGCNDCGTVYALTITPLKEQY